MRGLVHIFDLALPLLSGVLCFVKIACPGGN